MPGPLMKLASSVVIALMEFDLSDSTLYFFRRPEDDIHFISENDAGCRSLEAKLSINFPFASDLSRASIQRGSFRKLPIFVLRSSSESQRNR
jgi:hypothetical protein